MPLPPIRPVVMDGLDFTGLYGSSEDGRIWCMPKLVRRPGYTPYIQPMKELAPRKGNKHGHRKVTLYDKFGKPHHLWVARIVATAWCVRPPGKDFVLHDPPDPSVNAAWVLRWGTRSENELDKHKHRRMGL